MRFLLEHVPPNPTIEYANNVMLPAGTTEIVSRGGGSTIDVGKWIAKKYGLPHVAIPTTTGTGSEVTKYVVLTVDGKKKTFTDDAYIPNGYILDPHLAVTLPRLQTLSTGLDAFCQSVESLWSKNATIESSNFANVALQLIAKSFKEGIENPTNVNARMDMMIAANFSGRAINITKTNVCHAISYPLTDLYGIPHGIACAMSVDYFAKKANLPLDQRVKPMLPKYKIDRKKVAKEAILSPKLLDCPFPITELDILKSLV